MTAMVTRYFTFGYGHVDPVTGQSLADGYAKITAPTEEYARTLMFGLFGRRWAFDYSAENFERDLARFPELWKHIEITIVPR